MLKLENINYEIVENDVSKKILNDISFELNDQETLVITGQNGSGKSTLAKIIMGLIVPTSGKIYFNGQDITNKTVTQRAKMGMCFAFQQPVLFKGITVKKILDISNNQQNKIADCCESLSKVGLCARDYAERQLDNKLSGGELKRIEIATVISRDGKLNIFDEPEAGIDLWSFDSLVNIFKGNKKTNIIISHQSKIIEIADKILLLNGGNIVQYDDKDKVMPKLKIATCYKIGGAN